MTAPGNGPPAAARVWRLNRFGGEFRNSCDLESHPLPPLQPGQVLIENRFAGINAIFDRSACRDRIGYRHLTLPLGMGVEAVGLVRQAGPGVADLRPGMAVGTTRFGTAYRDYQIADAADVVVLPEASAATATLMTTGVSARVLLDQVARPQAGETAVVTAAAGGLGHLLIQMLVALDLNVIGICGGTEKAQLVQSLGAAAINYRAEAVGAALDRLAPGGINLAVDTVGGPLFDQLTDRLAVKGRLVVSGFAADMEPADEPPVLAPRIYTKLYWKGAAILSFQNALWAGHAAAARTRLLEDYAAGRIRPLAGLRPFKGIEAIPDAVDWMLSGASLGKVVAEF